MENIIKPNEDFNFNNLSLAHPVGIQGGAYFTKIQNNNNPLYIQTPKSLTRQGFVKAGKKYYCDLMFDKNSETMINWFENLEERCQKLIYEKSDSWFQSALEMNDVETAFNSVIRVYKSGKYYLVRANIKNNSVTNEPSVKIYNEHEINVNYTDINNDTNIISILEIQGIKFSSRNFQIEIEVKQIMILNNEPIFDSCLIKSVTKENLITKNTNAINDDIKNKDNKITIENDKKQNDDGLKMQDNEEQNVESEMGKTLGEIIINEMNSIKIDKNEIVTNKAIDNDNYKDTLDSIVDLDQKKDLYIEEKNDELKEVELSFVNENDHNSITLKKPNQVYFKLYKEAKNKAKQAKKSAILAYLEAKNIKKTYLLDNLNDSDSEFDEEIEEVSESELEGL